VGREIERKFLVCGEFRDQVTSALRISQGYIAKSDELTLRVRTLNEQGFLTIKGRTDNAGISRNEWEWEIPVEQARELLQYSKGTIEKCRYLVPCGEHTFEVDSFFGDNEGLVVAEVELSDPDEQFERPTWLGEEVTGDRRYYNSQLLKKPFKRWEK